MDTNARHVVNPLIQYAPPPEGGEFFNIGRPVRCCNPFWVGMTRGNVATTSWAAIWPAGNNEPKSPTVLCRLYPPRIRFSKRTLALTAKDGRRIFEPWIQDAPPPDGNVWVQRIWQAQKVLLQGLIRWGGGDRRMVDQPKEEKFRGQGLILFQIVLWALQGRFVQEW